MFSSLSVIGYLSYVPDIRQILVKNPNIPLRNELLAMDPQSLSLLILAGILLMLMAKVYFISIIWSCYKFLTMRAEGLREYIYDSSFFVILLHFLVNSGPGTR